MSNHEKVNPYHKFREIFYPGGTRNEESFATLSYLISEGYTNKQLAAYFGTTDTTLGNWKRNHSEILECFTNNKSIPDDKVERCLFERATGYQFIETKVNVVEGRIVQTDVVKTVPPDTTAAIYWLNNRRPDRWKSVVHTTNTEVPQPEVFNYDNLTPEEMDVYEKLLAKITPEQAPEEPEQQ